MTRGIASARVAFPVVAVAALCASGCVRRTVEITSAPTGALVLLNDREIGRTPATVEIDHYGTYDVQLRLDGFEPIDAGAEAVPPAWDRVGPDLFAELLPGTYITRNRWHFELSPWDRDPEAVLERAQVFRLRFDGEAASAKSDPRTALSDLGREVEADDAMPGEAPAPATTDTPMPGPATMPPDPIAGGD